MLFAPTCPRVQSIGSPERVEGEPHRMSSDCWSVGIIVLECALGYYPFADPKVCASSFFFFFVALADLLQRRLQLQRVPVCELLFELVYCAPCVSNRARNSDWEPFHVCVDGKDQQVWCLCASVISLCSYSSLSAVTHWLGWRT